MASLAVLALAALLGAPAAIAEFRETAADPVADLEIAIDEEPLWLFQALSLVFHLAGPFVAASGVFHVIAHLRGSPARLGWSRHLLLAGRLPRVVLKAFALFWALLGLVIIGLDYAETFGSLG